MKSDKKVVIIGGGFAGSFLAEKFENCFDTTLIDTKDYFEFTPGILRTIVQPNHMSKIQLLHSAYLHKAKIIRGEVSEINKKYVKIGKRKIYFDYLVICSGSKYSLPIKEDKIVITTRASHLRNSHRQLNNAKSVLIVGGGLVGIELAAEIVNYCGKKEITIVHANNRLIERNPERASEYVKKYLERRGVKMIFNELIVAHKNKGFISNKNNKFKADIAFLCTGINPNFESLKKNFSFYLNNKNQIKVNSYIQLNGFNNIFAPGDINDLNVEKTAQNAEKQAQTVYKNICALERGKELREYREKKTPLVISLGKYNGLFVQNNFVFTGLLPGLLKTAVEKREMFRRKFKWHI